MSLFGRSTSTGPGSKDAGGSAAGKNGPGSKNTGWAGKAPKDAPIRSSGRPSHPGSGGRSSGKR